MKIVIIGGTGLIGSKVVALLRARGHDAVPAALDTGVNTVTGEGLARVLMGAEVVVDVSNSPSLEDNAAMTFFETSTRNILVAEANAGVRHHVVLSIVGVSRMAASGYSKAKIAQERLVQTAPQPYSIVRATQFYEFINGIVANATRDGAVHLAPVMIQPIAAEDVARTVATVAVGAPVKGIVEVAGPQSYRLDELARAELRARRDPRVVVTDPRAKYFGAVLSECTLMPAADARIGEMTLETWHQRQAAQKQKAQSADAR